MNNYDDIINLPHHVSEKRPQMSLENRAAQFAPFSALTGYSDAIKEIGRLTNRKIELEEERKLTLNSKLQILKENLKSKPQITITYFIPDKTKNGGSYKKITGIIKKINTYEQELFLEDKTKIALDDIFEIEGEIFNTLYDDNML